MKLLITFLSAVLEVLLPTRGPEVQHTTTAWLSMSKDEIRPLLFSLPEKSDLAP